MSKRKFSAKFSRAALVGVVVLTTIARAFVGAGGVAAQSEDCVYLQDFSQDGSLEDWQPYDNMSVVEYLPMKQFGIWPFTDTMWGVMHIYQGDAVTSIYLNPGTYQLTFTAAATKLGVFNTPLAAIIYVDLFSEDTPLSFNVLFDGWITNNIDGGTFTVVEPGYVKIRVATTVPSSANYYYDDFCLSVVQPGDGTPTPTPIGATATPAPTGTPYCNPDEGTATPAPHQFLTPTPTPLPITNTWSFLDRFNGPGINPAYWEVIGGRVSQVSTVGRPTSTLGAVYIPNSDPFNSNIHEDRSGLIYIREAGFNDLFYLDLWAQAVYLPAGHSETVQVWARDSATWVLQDEHSVSGGYWYPLHFVIDGSSLVDPVEAIAIVSARDDSAETGAVYIDDVYIYGDLSLTQFCNGVIPNDDGGGSIGGDVVIWPADKPCPPAILEPNNFWGSLLAGITLLLDKLFAFSPYHSPNSFTTLVESLIQSPFVTFASIVTIFFDLRVPILIMLLCLLIEVGSWTPMLWLWVKKHIPFLN